MFLGSSGPAASFADDSAVYLRSVPFFYLLFGFILFGLALLISQLSARCSRLLGSPLIPPVRLLLKLVRLILQR